MDKLISVVIPVYNEQEHIERSISNINQEMLKTGFNYEIIIIDDGSIDHTWLRINNLKSQIPQIRALKFSRNFGKESALCAGLDNSKGHAAIIMDSDLQHPPYLIHTMIEKWINEDYEVVECVKTNRGNEPFINKFGAKVFYNIIDKLAGYELNGASDFKLLDRKVINEWGKMRERNVFFRGMTSWLGFKKTTLSFEVPNRAAGKSTWSIISLIKLAISAIVSFSSIPLRLVTVFGALFLGLALVLGGQTLYNKIVGNSVTGFTTVILLILFTGSILMICLGIIGEYIAAIYNEVKQRPRYIVSEELQVIGKRKHNVESFEDEDKKVTAVI